MKIPDLVTFLTSSLPSDHLEIIRFLRQVCLHGDVQMSFLVNVTVVVHFGKIVILKVVVRAWLL